MGCIKKGFRDKLLVGLFLIYGYIYVFNFKFDFMIGLVKLFSVLINLKKR